MWQPIETAPKDKQVLLYCPKRGVVRGRWDDCKYSTNPKPYWTHDRDRLYGVRETRNDQPTHWMHLPEAPGTQAQPAPSVPDGWKLVPIKPTRTMVDACVSSARAYMQEYGGNSPQVMWAAMLAAAPEAKP